MKNFKLRCPLKQYAKMFFWVDHCSIEGGGPFTIKENRKEKCYDLVQADIIKQVASPTHIAYEEKEYTLYSNAIKALETKEYKDILLKYMTEKNITDVQQVSFARMKGFVDKYKKENGFMYGQWHSHVNMHCTPSGTDVTNAENVCSTMPFMFMLIMNKRREYTLTRFENGVVGTRVEGDLEIVDESGKKVTIIDKEILNKEMKTGITQTIHRLYPGLADALIATVDHYCATNTECLSEAQLKEAYSDIYAQCKIDIDSLVFSENEYMVDPDSGEIVKKALEYPKWGGRQACGWSYHEEDYGHWDPQQQRWIDAKEKDKPEHDIFDDLDNKNNAQAAKTESVEDILNEYSVFPHGYSTGNKYSPLGHRKSANRHKNQNQNHQIRII